MRCMFGIGLVAILAVLGQVAAVQAQDETPSAKATRKKLQQKISIEFKEVGFKAALDEIKSEFDNRLGIKIDTTTGISLNSKISYKAKDKTLETILNEMADKFEFGYYVISKPGDRYDGWLMVRKFKEKERGYEWGKEPKKEEPKDKGAQMHMNRLLNDLAQLIDEQAGVTSMVYERRLWAEYRSKFQLTPGCF